MRRTLSFRPCWLVAILLLVKLVEVFLQEIITGRLPLHEIRRGPGVSRAVTEGRTPQVGELEALMPSPRAMMMLGILYRCWHYTPSERATAKEVRAVVSLSTCDAPHSDEIADIYYRWNRSGLNDLNAGSVARDQAPFGQISQPFDDK
jgi:hypothetical protein